MNRMHSPARGRGFTLIELLVVIAVASMLLAVAAPGFSAFFGKRRVEGVATELSTDLQYARSEAVSRNQNVRVSFGSGCYTVHLASATAVSCTSSGGSSVTPASALIKAVQVTDTSALTMAAQSSLTSVTFEPVLGAATFVPNTVDPGVINVTNARGTAFQVQLRVSAQGRVRTCSSNIAGYSTDCGDS